MRVLLVTGPPGSGKTTVLMAIGDLLEAGPRPYALVDLDWLAWVRPDPARATVREVLTWNLASALASFRDAGIREVVASRFLPDPGHLEAVEAALPPGATLTVVRLEVPAAVIARRLARRDAPDDRDGHLAMARDAVPVPGAVDVDGDAPPAEVASRILAAAGW
ncbi:MAG: AAA family ATPase [Thermoleophilia bacterium]|nr:AAA family ATPase [Thermoleophilia bacterium]